MKIMMISSNTAVSPYPIYPLGLSIVSGALKDAGHEVRQFDFLMEDSSMDSVVREIREYGPELIGISIRNIDNVNFMNEQFYIDTVRDIVSAVRTVSDCRIVLGGAGFSLMPELILQRTGADYGIAGEGDVLMVEFANNAATGNWPDMRVIGPRGHLAGNMIASAYYDEVLMGHYLKSGNIASVQTKRGCTHKCVYCTYPVLEGSAIRQRDHSAVIDDIKLLSEKHGANYIFFVDSVFNDDKGEYIGLLEEMARRNVNVPWTGFFTPRGLTDEIIELMKRTGLIAVEIGSDAACDTTLRKMGKGFSFQDIVECNDLFARHEVATSHFYMMGGPGETEETVEEGIRNITGLKKCVNFIFMGIRILPNTVLHKIALKEKVISPDDDLLKPVYYISPGVDREKMEKVMTEAFSKTRNCIFPPDAYDSTLRMLHKLGYPGTLWNLLLVDKKRHPRKQHASE
ncbi:MAG: lipid biosynthesis B12-binding/radical SAM protein [Nitrospirota bacterium]